MIVVFARRCGTLLVWSLVVVLLSGAATQDVLPASITVPPQTTLRVRPLARPPVAPRSPAARTRSPAARIPPAQSCTPANALVVLRSVVVSPLRGTTIGRVEAWSCSSVLEAQQRLAAQEQLVRL